MGGCYFQTKTMSEKAKVKITRDCFAGGKPYKRGEIVELAKILAGELITARAAESARTAKDEQPEVESAVSRPAKKAAKRAPKK